MKSPKLKFIGLLAGTAAIALYPASAMAAPLTEQQAAALLGKMNQLKRRVADRKAHLGNVQQTQQVSTSAIAATEAKIAAAEEKLEKQKPVKVGWKGAPEMKGDDGWRIKPRGRILYDFGTVNAPNSIIDRGLGFANEARRIRLGGSGYKLEAGFAGNEVDLTDAFFTYEDGGIRRSAKPSQNTAGVLWGVHRSVAEGPLLIRKSGRLLLI